MPQKKNPDSLELIRGKAARVFGHVTGLLTMAKGTPLAYNKDFQEDKEALFDTFDTVTVCLEVVATVLRNIEVNQDRAREAASSGYMNATELADYLVRRGMPFREAHQTVGRMVIQAIERGIELEALSLTEMRSFSELIGEDVFGALTLESTLARKSQTGGTARERVAEALADARSQLGR